MYLLLCVQYFDTITQVISWLFKLTLTIRNWYHVLSYIVKSKATLMEQKFKFLKYSDLLILMRVILKHDM